MNQAITTLLRPWHRSHGEPDFPTLAQLPPPTEILKGTFDCGKFTEFRFEARTYRTRRGLLVILQRSAVPGKPLPLLEHNAARFGWDVYHDTAARWIFIHEAGAEQSWWRVHPRAGGSRVIPASARDVTEALGNAGIALAE